MQDGPTLRDVAAKAGVAPITASRILNGSRTASPIAAATRLKVEEAAAALGYRLDAVARAMRHRRSGQIGVVVANMPGHTLSNLPAYEYILGLNLGLDPLGYMVSLIRLTDVDGAHPERIRALEERLLDALVVLGHMPQRVLARLRERQQRMIWLDTDVDEATGCVRRDERSAGRDAAGLLLSKGRRRIIWPQRPGQYTRDHYSTIEREAGAREACAAAGATFEIWPSDDDYGPGSEASLPDALRDPTVGILLDGTTSARRVLGLLGRSAVVPGRDLGVAACDADEHLNYSWSNLSRVQVKRDEIGRRAATMMQEMLEQGVSPPSVLIRSAVIAGTTA
jgi:DNA-binding LacI/PurR family transcriptional regulator